MKPRTFLFIVVTFTLIASACSTKTSNTHVSNSNTHGGMNHNAPQNAHEDHANEGHSAMKSSPGAESAPYDLQFLDTMVAHHEGAVDMARAAQATQRDEIKKLAADIISSQNKEISMMRDWREKWFPGAAPAINMDMSGMDDSMKGMDMALLNTLKGNEFDLEFLKQMIPHHEGAVVMSREAIAKSTKPEIKNLANQIIKAQEAEINQMRSWQSVWKK